MALTLLGSGTANFDTKADVVFPSLTLQRARAYFFFINTVPAPVLPKKQYILLFAKYQSGTFIHESKLIAKFFSNGPRMMFVVPVPDLSFMPNSYSTQVIARPSEFFKGSGLLRTVPLQLSWDDSKFINSLTAII